MNLQKMTDKFIERSGQGCGGKVKRGHDRLKADRV